jgi:hypothetical protein
MRAAIGPIASRLMGRRPIMPVVVDPAVVAPGGDDELAALRVRQGEWLRLIRALQTDLNLMHRWGDEIETWAKEWQTYSVNLEQDLASEKEKAEQCEREFAAAQDLKAFSWEDAGEADEPAEGGGKHKRKHSKKRKYTRNRKHTKKRKHTRKRKCSR